MPSSRFCGWYATRSETSARARRRARWPGSALRNGLIGRLGASVAPLAVGTDLAGVDETGVEGGVGTRVATAAMTAAVGRGVGTGAGAGAKVSGARGGGTRDAAGIGVVTLGADGAAATAAELSDGVANADCTTPADALVTMTGNVPPAIAITPPHTEQRARTPLAGTLAGSTRKTERQSGHATVIVYHFGWQNDWPTHQHALMVPCLFRSQLILKLNGPALRPRLVDDPQPIWNPEASWRSSSSR